MVITKSKITGANGNSAELIVRPGDWSVTHAPAANTKATASKAAAAGVVHVATSISVALVAGATAPTAVTLTVNLIDGASGGSTYLWQSAISLAAVAGQSNPINLSGLNLAGTAGTAMTLEFSAAGGTNTVESVTLTGYDLV